MNLRFIASIPKKNIFDIKDVVDIKQINTKYAQEMAATKYQNNRKKFLEQKMRKS